MFGKSQLVTRAIKSAVEIGTTAPANWASGMAGDYRLLTSEWVNFVNSRTLFGRIQFRRAAFRTKTLFEATPGTAQWVGESEYIPATILSLDTLLLDRTKIGAIVFFTEESLQSWNTTTSTQISNSLMRVIARYMDEALLSPGIAAVAEKNPRSLTYGITPVTSTGPTEAAITANILSLLAQLDVAGADPAEVVIAMHPTTGAFVGSVLTAGGQRAYPNVGARGGNIFGIPVLTTPGAVSYGSPSERVIVAINPMGIIVADENDITVSSSNTAAVQMETLPQEGAQPLVSLWQTETRAIKAIRYVNFASVPGSVAYMSVAY